MSGLFIPSPQDLGHGWKYGYVVHTNQRGMYKLDLQAMKYLKTVDLTPYNCAPTSADFASFGKFKLPLEDKNALSYLASVYMRNAKHDDSWTAINFVNTLFASIYRFIHRFHISIHYFPFNRKHFRRPTLHLNKFFSVKNDIFDSSNLYLEQQYLK